MRSLVRVWREKTDPLGEPVIKSERTGGDGLSMDEVEFGLREREEDAEWIIRFRIRQDGIMVRFVRPNETAHEWSELPDIDSAVVEMATFIADFQGSRGTGLEALTAEGIVRAVSE